jgi:hypothetical protein
MNQYRCDNGCYFENHRDKGCPIWEIYDKTPYKEKCGWDWWMKHGQVVSEVIGCASHSDFKGEQKGQICIHCEVRNDVQFCHFHDVPIKSERDKVLDGRKLYQCNSDTCSDSGGVCILCIPDMDFAPPTSCVNPEAFTDNGDEPDCKWTELRHAGEP